MARGGITVVSIQTGGYVIQDINTPVPQRVAVTIPGALVLKSKDLYRALQQGYLFQLDGGMVVADSADNGDASALALENGQLRKKLQAVELENKSLKGALATLQEQFNAVASDPMAKMETILATLERIGTGGGGVVVAPAAAKPTEAVGGEVPTYLPDKITPDTAKASITTEDDTSEGTSVDAAASRLKKLRASQAEDIELG